MWEAPYEISLPARVNMSMVSHSLRRHQAMLRQFSFFWSFFLLAPYYLSESLSLSLPAIFALSNVDPPPLLLKCLKDVGQKKQQEVRDVLQEKACYMDIIW